MVRELHPVAETDSSFSPTHLLTSSTFGKFSTHVRSAHQSKTPNKGAGYMASGASQVKWPSFQGKRSPLRALRLATDRESNSTPYNTAHAFSSDGSRLVTCGRGLLQVWQTPCFRELCRVNTEQRDIVNIGFVAEDNSSFIVFYNLFAAETYRVVQCPTTQQLHIKKGRKWPSDSYRLASTAQYQPAAATDFLSVEETGTTFVHCSRRPDAAIDLALTSMNEKSVRQCSFAKHLDSSFRVSHANWRGSQLLVVGNEVNVLGDRTARIGLWSFNPGAAASDLFRPLKGSDGRFAGIGDLILTWDGCASMSPRNRRFVLMFSSEMMQQKTNGTESPESTVTEATLTPETQQSAIWTYRTANDMTVLHASLISRVNSTGIMRASDIKVILLCDIEESEGSKIFLIDAATKTVDFQISTSWNYKREMRSPFDLTRDLYEHIPFSVSPDQKWLLLCDRSLQEATLYSLIHGFPVTTCRHDTIRMHPKQIRFSPCGRSVLLGDGVKLLTLDLTEQETSRKQSAWTRALTEETIALVEYCKKYDRASLQRLIAKGINGKREVRSTIASLVETDIIGDIEEKTRASAAPEGSVQIVLSPGAELAAFISQSDPVRIEFWTIGELQDGIETPEKIRRHVLLPGMQADESIGPGLGVFHQNDAGETAFALISPRPDGVRIARVMLENQQVIGAPMSLLVDGGPVAAMKVTEDTKKALIIFENRRFAVVKLEDDFSTMISGKLPCPFRLDEFVNFFIAPSLIHISEDCKQLAVGWDYDHNCLVTFPLGGKLETNVGIPGKNYDHLTARNFGLVLWMKHDWSQVIVHRKEVPTFQLEFYEISGSCARRLHVIEGLVLRASRISNSFSVFEWSKNFIPNRFDELRACCMYSLQMLQEMAPDPDLIQLLGLEMTEASTREWIVVFGVDVITATDSQKKSLLHQSIMEHKLDCAKLLFDFAASENILVDLSWDDGDVLEWSLQKGQLDSVQFILDRIARKCSAPMESAKIISQHFSALIKQFPDTMGEFLREDNLCFEYGRFQVPASFFQGGEKGRVAMLCDEEVDWEAASSDEAKNFWLRHNPQLRESLHASSESHVTAVSKFVAVESPLRAGPQSFLSSLLSAKPATETFQSETVAAPVQWKWQLSTRKLHSVIAAICAISTFFFIGLAASSAARVGGGKALALCVCCALFLSLLLLKCEGRYSSSPRSWTTAVAAPLSLLVLSCFQDHGSMMFILFVLIQCCFSLTTWFQTLRPFRKVNCCITMMHNAMRDMSFVVTLICITAVAFGMASTILFATTSLGVSLVNAQSCQNEIETDYPASPVPSDSQCPQVSRSWMTAFISVCQSNTFFVCVVLSIFMQLSLLTAILSEIFRKTTSLREATLVKRRAQVVERQSSSGLQSALYKIYKAVMELSCWPPTLRALQTFLHSLSLGKSYDLIKKWMELRRRFEATVDNEQWLLSAEGQIFHFLVPADSVKVLGENKRERKTSTFMKMTRSLVSRVWKKDEGNMKLLKEDMVEIKKKLDEMNSTAAGKAELITTGAMYDRVSRVENRLDQILQALHGLSHDNMFPTRDPSSSLSEEADSHNDESHELFSFQ